MAVDFKTFLSVSQHVLKAKLPIIIRGRHGIGKSEIIYQIAKEMGLPVVERRASQMTEGDLIGLPSIDGNSTTWNPPDWFKHACDNACLVFLDEVDRGTEEVRQGIFELNDSRKLNGHTLHPDTVIVAAINGGEHGAEYQVGEMDPAELDRYTVFDLEPTVEDWLTWAKDEGVNQVVWDFINNNRNHLEHEGSFEPNKVYPSRRSWVRLNNTLEAASLLMEKNIKDPAIYTLAQAFVGFEAAVKFKDFVSNFKHQVSVEDIIDNGKLDLVKDFGINDHAALIEKIDQLKSLQVALTDKQVENVAEYFAMLPGELAMKLLTVVFNEAVNMQDEKGSNLTRFCNHALASGTLIKDYVVELIQGEALKEGGE